MNIKFNIKTVKIYGVYMGENNQKFFIDMYQGEISIAIWGCGYIGLTTAINFAINGINSYAYDIDINKINQLNKGENPIPNLEYWCGTNLNKVLKSKKIKFVSDIYYLENCSIHFIAIPTEKNMRPYYGALMEVLSDIIDIVKNNKKINYIIIESTLTPGTFDKIIIPYLKRNNVEIGDDVILAVAPRRDWFVSQEKNLSNLPRVMATYKNYKRKEVKEILSIICKKIIISNNYKSVEMMKSVENTFRYIEITLANQLFLAYPDENINEVLNLCSTKWNMQEYYCSFGIGGYCVPLAAQYLIEGSIGDESLSIVRQAQKFNMEYLDRLVDFYNLKRFSKIGILGLSYKENIKVFQGSPTIKLCEILLQNNIEVKVNDPYYSSDEIMKYTRCNKMDIGVNMNELECIIVMVAHEEYKLSDINKLINKNSKIKMVIDQSGVWSNYEWENKKIIYKQVGK